MWDFSSLTSNWTRVRCIAQQILSHWTTKEVPPPHLFLNWIILMFSRKTPFCDHRETFTFTHSKLPPVMQVSVILSGKSFSVPGEAMLPRDLCWLVGCWLSLYSPLSSSFSASLFFSLSSFSLSLSPNSSPSFSFLPSSLLRSLLSFLPLIKLMCAHGEKKNPAATTTFFNKIEKHKMKSKSIVAVAWIFSWNFLSV